MSNQIQNAYLWNDFLMQGDEDWSDNDNEAPDLSGMTWYGTASGAHSAIPKTTTASTSGAAALQSATTAAHNAAAAVTAVNAGATSLPAQKKLFFDVIKKPYAIAGAAVLALGVGYLVFHHKQPAAKSTALKLHECH